MFDCLSIPAPFFLPLSCLFPSPLAQTQYSSAFLFLLPSLFYSHLPGTHLCGYYGKVQKATPDMPCHLVPPSFCSLKAGQECVPRLCTVASLLRLFQEFLDKFKVSSCYHLADKIFIPANLTWERRVKINMDMKAKLHMNAPKLVHLEQEWRRKKKCKDYTLT